MTHLSARGRRLVDSAARSDYFEAHFERAGDPGYVGLAIAENRLMWDVIGPRLSAPRALRESAAGYDEMIGNRRLRTRIGELMERTWLGRPVDASRVAVLNGAGTALEILFHVIADPGDCVLVPTPSYAGFWGDLETRDELKIIPVPTGHGTRFRLTTDLLDEALSRADRPVRALLFTNPDNPLGTITPAGDVAELMQWAGRRGLHFVLDEIYALSVHDGTPFASGAASGLPEHAHLVWAFSKDFSMSGLRCGVVVTENAKVMQAVDALGYWTCVAGDTQSVLADILEDRAWVDAYLESMRSRLAASYRAVARALEESGVPYVPASAGFFLFADLSRFLLTPTWEAEDALWRRLLDVAGVNLTPGSACRAPDPGHFRIVYAAAPPERSVEAIQRIGRVLNG